MSLQRVSKKEPCPCCGKTTWCMIGETATICMRVSSPKPFTFKNGDVGHFHDNGAPRKDWKPVPRAEPVPIDCLSMMTKWHKETTPLRLISLAKSLGVEMLSLDSMGVSWSHYHQAFAFPMYDGFGIMVGIRLRDVSGKKWAVSGSKQGLFMTTEIAKLLRKNGKIH